VQPASVKADVVPETEAMSMFRDYPFGEVTTKAEALANAGHEVFQKFTCAGCGARLTIGEPNIFHETGTCDKCETITDIKKQGCNYMVHMRVR
jgi:hypothetical protein